MNSKFLSIVIYFFSFVKSNSKSTPVSESLIETSIPDNQLLLDTTQTRSSPVKSFLKESSPDHFFYYDFPDDFSIYYKNPDAIHLETQPESQLIQSFNPDCLSATRMKRFIVLRVGKSFVSVSYDNYQILSVPSVEFLTKDHFDLLKMMTI